MKEKEKPKPKSPRVKLTDYIQEIWPIEPNWKWMSKQIENLSKETGLGYNDMRMVLKYCIEYKKLEPDESYGLQQFIPKYCKEADDFAEDIMRIKELAKTIPEEEYNIVKPRPKRGHIKENLDF